MYLPKRLCNEFIRRFSRFVEKQNFGFGEYRRCRSTLS